MTALRRDPRRLFTPAQRDLIASRQHQICGGTCGKELAPGFHVHHVIPWSIGGLTEIGNGIAVCPDCHITAPISQLAEFQPRRWQIDALANVIPILRCGLFATVSAAPGAGKTLFAAAAYRQLRDVGDVGRLVTFVPNKNLRTQWAEEAKALNVFLRHDATTEHPSEDGVVLTYHALSNPGQIVQIEQDATDTPTLFILDEVHHLAKDISGQAGSWAIAVDHIVGNYAQPRHRVLNLSGTLFRSKPTERISTINYLETQTPDGPRIETVADATVTANELQQARQLRLLKVLGYDLEMHVTALDLGGLADAETIRAVDVDENARLRSPLLARMVRDDTFIRGVITETVSRLAYASDALEGSAPVKALIIADGIAHARQTYAILAEIIGTNRAFLAFGSDKAAEDEIQRFRNCPGQAIMVAVQKVTEGFDVPDICVLTYMRTWRAMLFLNQMVGRAMRVTKRERDLGLALPATIIIPNDVALKKAFANVFSTLEAFETEPCLRCGKLVCACPPMRRPRGPDEPPPPWDKKDKICADCGFPWRLCVCECGHCGLSRNAGCICYRFANFPVDIRAVGAVELGSVQVQSGAGFAELDLNLLERIRTKHKETNSHAPLTYLEEFTHLVQSDLESDPMTYAEYLRRKGGER